MFTLQTLPTPANTLSCFGGTGLKNTAVGVLTIRASHKRKSLIELGGVKGS